MNVIKKLAHAGLLSSLAACGAFAPFAPEPVDPNGPSVTFAPEIIALLPPGQDLRNVVLQEDKCYWFLHSGPVEDTFIPLQTREGRGICVARR